MLFIDFKFVIPDDAINYFETTGFKTQKMFKTLFRPTFIKAHLDGKYVLTIDIKKFYDNCTREPVYQFFVQKLKTSPDVAKKLTDINHIQSEFATALFRQISDF